MRFYMLQALSLVVASLFLPFPSLPVLCLLLIHAPFSLHYHFLYFQLSHTCSICCTCTCTSYIQIDAHTTNNKFTYQSVHDIHTCSYTSLHTNIQTATQRTYSSIPHAVPTVIPPVLPPDAIPPVFTITSWNASSLLSRGPAVQLYLHHYRPSILVIIESRIQETDKIPHHAAYNIMHIHHAHQHAHGGLILYIHRSITCQQQHNISCTFDPNTASTVALLHVSSTQLKQPIMLIPTYMSCTATTTDWNTYLRFIRRAPCHINPRRAIPTIIIGDLNAKDPSWDMQHAQQHTNTAGMCRNQHLLIYFA